MASSATTRRLATGLIEPAKVTARHHKVGLGRLARPDHRTWVVYAMLDAGLEPVYVGSTCALASRVKAHRSRAWWADVVYMSWQVCEQDFRRRFVDERQAIATLAPRHNRTSNYGADTARRLSSDLHERLGGQVANGCPDYVGRAFLRWVDDLAERAIVGSNHPLLRVDAGPVSAWESAS